MDARAFRKGLVDKLIAFAEAFERTKKRKVKTYRGPPCPPELDYLWDIYNEISDRDRKHLPAGLSVFQLPITHRDLLNYMDCWKVELDYWERKVIFQLDDVLLPIMNLNKGKKRDYKKDGIPATELEVIRATWTDAMKSGKRIIMG